MKLNRVNRVLNEVDRISIRFDFAIQGKARPKFNGQSGRCYMPARYMNNKDAIAWVLRDAMAFRLDKPSFMCPNHGYIQEITAYRKRRKHTSKPDKARLEKQRPIGGWCHGASMAADLDNFIGTIMDAAQGVLYTNDSHIVKSTEERLWGEEWGADYTLIKTELHEWL